MLLFSRRDSQYLDDILSVAVNQEKRRLTAKYFEVKETKAVHHFVPILTAIYDM
jgi:hypothetical protein